MASKSRSEELLKGAAHLIECDSVLAPVVTRYGKCTIEPHENYYQQLVNSIIGQQLSVKAAAKIRERFLNLFGGKFPAPKDILEVPDEQIKSVGFSRPKVAYIKDLASHILDGKLNIERLQQLSNEEVIHELIAVKGIGEWTAHMFLIFSIGRLDVLATGDLGVRMAIKRLYELAEVPSPQTVTDIAKEKRWHPYESLACWYLWRSLDNEPSK